MILQILVGSPSRILPALDPFVTLRSQIGKKLERTTFELYKRREGRADVARRQLRGIRYKA